MIVGISWDIFPKVHLTAGRWFVTGCQVATPSEDCDVLLVIDRPCERDMELVRNWVKSKRALIVARHEPEREDLGEWQNPWLFDPIEVFDQPMMWSGPETVQELLEAQQPEAYIAASSSWELWDGLLAGKVVFCPPHLQHIPVEPCYLIKLSGNQAADENLIKLCREQRVHDKMRHRLADERSRLLREFNLGARIIRAMAMRQ